MKRKIEWIFRAIYNSLRFPLKFTIYRNKFKFSIIQFISPKVKFKINNNGSISLGSKCMIEDGVLIRSSGGKITIGNSVYINRNCNIVSMKQITIHDKVTIGPNVCIYDHNHDFKNISDEDFTMDNIEIGENTWIGANVIILKGVKIGSNSVIAAGTTVTKNIDSNTIIYPDQKYIKKIYR